jgi:hypothetical protein
LIVAKNKSMPEPLPQVESGLGPLHVYQMMLACSDRVQDLADQNGVLSMPTLSSKPRRYAPRDVLFVVGLMRDSLQRVAATLEIEELPTTEIPVMDKTPTDVFGLAAQVFLKLSVLCGHENLSPSEACAEMERAVDDARSILQQADRESRYRIDAPPSERDLLPADVFAKCIEIRRLINKHRASLGEPEIPVPIPPTDYAIKPRDVLIQSQILIAELNLLKLYTNTVSSTPLAIPAKSSKLPSDVHEQASLLEYLLRQIKTGADTSIDNNG